MITIKINKKSKLDTTVRETNDYYVYDNISKSIYLFGVRIWKKDLVVKNRLVKEKKKEKEKSVGFGV